MLCNSLSLCLSLPLALGTGSPVCTGHLQSENCLAPASLQVMQTGKPLKTVRHVGLGQTHGTGSIIPQADRDLTHKRLNDNAP